MIMNEPGTGRPDDTNPDDEKIGVALTMLRYAIEVVAGVALTRRLHGALMNLSEIDPGIDRVSVADPDAIETVEINGDKVNPANNALYYARDEPPASIVGLDTRAMAYNVVALWVATATRWDRLTSWGCLAAARAARIIINEAEAAARELGTIPGVDDSGADEVVEAEVSRIHAVRKIILRTVPVVADLGDPVGVAGRGDQGGVSFALIHGYIPPTLRDYTRPALAHLVMEGRARMWVESGHLFFVLADKPAQPFADDVKDGGTDS